MTRVNEKIRLLYKYSSHDISISAEQHVEPAVIPRLRSLACFYHFRTAVPRTQLSALYPARGSKIRRMLGSDIWLHTFC